MKSTEAISPFHLGRITAFVIWDSAQYLRIPLSDYGSTEADKSGFQECDHFFRTAAQVQHVFIRRPRSSSHPVRTNYSYPPGVDKAVRGPHRRCASERTSS